MASLRAVGHRRVEVGGRTCSEEKSKMVVLLGVQLIASGHLKLIPSLDQMPVAAALGQLPGR